FTPSDGKEGWNYMAEQRPGPWSIPVKAPGDRVNVSFHGFELLHAVDQNDFLVQRRWFLRLPLWLFFPFAIPPVIWWRSWCRRGGRGFAVVQTGTIDPQNAQRAQ